MAETQVFITYTVTFISVIVLIIREITSEWQSGNSQYGILFKEKDSIIFC